MCVYGYRTCTLVLGRSLHGESRRFLVHLLPFVRHVGLAMRCVCQLWVAGPMWPFETAKAISGAINALNTFAPGDIPSLTHDRLWTMLWQYTQVRQDGAVHTCCLWTGFFAKELGLYVILDR